ncbi:hypothetical protein B0H21DRAFT_334560 [Amylocystis lapponica]|nr:hypothetical protein B0H21DRAFT_334560 [Amylocystis lapponica]
MVDWTSSDELVLDGEAFLKLMHALAGLYFWEFAISLDFDWAFISGQKRFRWPLAFYMAGRYCLLAALIGILVALDSTSEINCQALYTFNQFAGNAAVGLASINLSIRTIAVWNQSRYVVIPLVLVIFGHWSLILQGVLLKAAWIPGTGCDITNTNNTILAATFIYSMCFDALVMCLNAWKLARNIRRSQIMALLFKDGLIYFVVAFVSNLIATVFMVLNLNSVMSVIFNVPAAVGSTIVASRAVRRLIKFTDGGVTVYTSSGSHSFRAKQGPVSSHIASHISPVHVNEMSAGVHVQMQTFTVTDGDRLSEIVGDMEETKRRAADLESSVSVGSGNFDSKEHAF